MLGHALTYICVCTESMLGLITRLQFRRDQLMSEVLLRSFVGAPVPPAYLYIYPRLLGCLFVDPNMHKDRLDQGSVKTNVTRTWVDRMLEGASPADGIVRLVEHLDRYWHDWNADVPELREPRASMEAQMSQLHKRPGMGGGETLLQVAKMIGSSAELVRPDCVAVKRWLVPSIEEFLTEWIDDQYQGGQRASRVVEIMTTPSVGHGRGGGIVVPHALSRELLTFMLNLIGGKLPKVKLLNHLLREDQCRLWCLLLQHESGEAATVVATLAAHETLDQVRNEIGAFGHALDSASITVAAGLQVLRESAKSDHGAIRMYLEALSLDTERPVQILAAIEALLQTHEELEHFLQRCGAADDHEAFEERLLRIKQLEGLCLNKTGYCPARTGGQSMPVNDCIRGQSMSANDCVADEYFQTFTPEIREAAKTCFRLRNSQLFTQEWNEAERARAEVAEAAGEECTVHLLSTEVYEAAKASFFIKCTQLIDNEDITLGAVRHILGTQLKREMLEEELELLFSNQPRARVEALKHRLVWFTSLPNTMRDASAIDGLVKHLCTEDSEERTEEGEHGNSQTELMGELLDECVRHGLLTESEVDALKDHLASGETTDKQLYDEWSQRLAAHKASRAARCSALVRRAHAVKDTGVNDGEKLRVFAQVASAFYEELRPFPEMVDMATTLSNPRAGELIDFLNSVTDLRILADAQDGKDMAGTINALMKVRELLKPILTIDEDARSGPSRTLPEAFQKITAAARAQKTSGPEATAMLIECCSNLDGLRSAYAGLSDKSGQSKLKIASIVAQGHWTFEAQGGHVKLPDGTLMQLGREQFVVVCVNNSRCGRACPPPEYVSADPYRDVDPFRNMLNAVGADLTGVDLLEILDDLFVSTRIRSDVSFDYRVEIPMGVFEVSSIVHGFELCSYLSSMELDDLRSRALLQSRTKQDSGNEQDAAQLEELQTFLQLAEKADNIGELIRELIELGHFEAQRFGVDEVYRVKSSAAALTTQHDELEQMCEEWRHELKAVRAEHYLTSFFCSSQLRQVWQLLCSGEESPRSFRDLLRYIPAEPTLKAFTQSLEANATGSNFRALGHALDAIFENSTPRQIIPPGWPAIHGVRIIPSNFCIATAHSLTLAR